MHQRVPMKVFDALQMRANFWTPLIQLLQLSEIYAHVVFVRALLTASDAIPINTEHRLMRSMEMKAGCSGKLESDTAGRLRNVCNRVRNFVLKIRSERLCASLDQDRRVECPLRRNQIKGAALQFSQEERLEFRIVPLNPRSIECRQFSIPVSVLRNTL